MMVVLDRECTEWRRECTGGESLGRDLGQYGE